LTVTLSEAGREECLRTGEGDDGSSLCLVIWDKVTMDSMPAEYKTRCAKEEFIPSEMNLGVEQLDVYQRPENPPDPMLSEKVQNDRVKIALGLSSEDRIPSVRRILC